MDKWFDIFNSKSTMDTMWRAPISRRNWENINTFLTELEGEICSWEVDGIPALKSSRSVEPKLVPEFPFLSTTGHLCILNKFQM